MRASLKSSGRAAAIVFALGLGAASLATPALAFSRGGSVGGVWPHGGAGMSGHVGGNFAHRGGNFRGRGGWGPGIGAAVVGGLVGGALIGSAGYPYYGSDPCWQYQDIYSAGGAYLGRQLVNTCQ
jgi:hypothetical protein